MKIVNHVKEGISRGNCFDFLSSLSSVDGLLTKPNTADEINKIGLARLLKIIINSQTNGKQINSGIVFYF